MRKKFRDAISFQSAARTAISVRDGVIEYLGEELALEPHDKVFTVYRSPATIGNAAMLMKGIPVTDEHISLDVPAESTGGVVAESSLIDAVQPDTRTYVAIKNVLTLDEDYAERLKGKAQLSLGYFGDLVPHDVYDFEQKNITPHHLAAVPSGRCGELCSFLDRKYEPKKEGKNMNGVFCDENGDVSLEKVIEVALALPEAIKTLSLEELEKVLPTLTEIVNGANGGSVGAKDAEEEKDDDVPDEEKPKFSDADFKQALDEKMQSFADAAVTEYSKVVEKARLFLDASFDFTGKTAVALMRESVKTKTAETFTDEELPTAFKLLSRTADYRSFGDNKQVHPLDSIADKEL